MRVTETENRQNRKFHICEMEEEEDGKLSFNGREEFDLIARLKIYVALC